MTEDVPSKYLTFEDFCKTWLRVKTDPVVTPLHDLWLNQYIGRVERDKPVRTFVRKGRYV